MNNEWENPGNATGVSGAMKQENASTNGLITETEADWQSSASMTGMESDWQNIQTQSEGAMNMQTGTGYPEDGMAVSTAVPYTPEVVRSNVITGTVGALLGSLVGVALWVLIYQLGYLAGIAGAVMIVCAMFGYEKLGKSLDTKGVVICVILSIVMIFLAQQLAMTLAVVQAFKNQDVDVSFGFMFRNLFKHLEYLDLMSVFVRDLAVGYVLFFIASISTIAKAFRGSR
ncbi:MAG: hypothetical protein Q4D32_03245 [Eubacteriales bacterium]|nr:hypothetical protein [Eubacteriales bacterium]